MRCIFLLSLSILVSSNVFAAADATGTSDCIFLAEISDTKQKDKFPLQYCMYTHTETRGIFAATACVGVLIESQSQTRHPFYGDHGHWGIEGKCEGSKILSKFKEHETMATLNPITDIRNKRKAGKTVKILKDDYKIGDEFLKITTPEKTTSKKAAAKSV